MRIIVLPLLLTASLLTASVSARAAQEGQAVPAGAPAAAPAAAPGAAGPAKTGSPATTRSDAAEARYREWVEKEHARDAAEFAKDKSKIESKYKGYVRPKREKKDGKAEPADKPAKP